MHIPMQPLTAFSPYSLENFKWLMEKSTAKLYLSEESLQKINDAFSKNDPTVLQELYPIILGQYIAERDISINFALSQENAMQNFINKVEKIGLKIKAEVKESNRVIEEQEHAEAENLLKNL